MTVDVLSGDPVAGVMHRLVRLRQERGLKQRDIAVRMRVSPARISHLESGYRIPNLDTVMRYARAVGAEVVVVPVEKLRRAA